MEKRIFSGAHGTSCNNAKVIGAGGFKRGLSGYWGGGVYFFDAHDCGKTRARNWAQSSAARRIHGDEHGACAVIVAHISCPLDNYIDLSEQELADAFEEIHSDTCKKLKGLSKEEFNKALQRRSLIFLNDVIKEYGSCDILNAPIPLPKPEKGRGYCLVVYHEHCIKPPPYEVEYECKACKYYSEEVVCAALNEC